MHPNLTCRYEGLEEPTTRLTSAEQIGDEGMRWGNAVQSAWLDPSTAFRSRIARNTAWDIGRLQARQPRIGVAEVI